MTPKSKDFGELDRKFQVHDGFFFLHFSVASTCCKCVIFSFHLATSTLLASLSSDFFAICTVVVHVFAVLPFSISSILPLHFLLSIFTLLLSILSFSFFPLLPHSLLPCPLLSFRPWHLSSSLLSFPLILSSPLLSPPLLSPPFHLFPLLYSPVLHSCPLPSCPVLSSPLPSCPLLSSQGLLEHQLIDPLEGIMQLRKIIYHFAAIPRLLGSELVVSHIVSKDLLEIFEVSARDQGRRKGVMEGGREGRRNDGCVDDREDEIRRR